MPRGAERLLRPRPLPLQLALRATFFFGGLLAVLLSAAPRAMACSCLPPPPTAVALEHAAVVFEGKVEDVVVSLERMQTVVSLKLLRVWKGRVVESIRVVTSS